MDGDLPNFITVSVEQLMHAWETDLFEISKLIFAFSYLAGMASIFRALYYLKVYGEARTMMATTSNAAAPVAMLIFGACLIYLPTAIDILNFTLFNTNSLLEYAKTEDVMYNNFMTLIGWFVKVIGFIAVVRGFIILTGIGKQSGNPPGAIGKGVTHLIGGILLINFWTTTAVFANFFGVSW